MRNAIPTIANNSLLTDPPFDRNEILMLHRSLSLYLLTLLFVGSISADVIELNTGQRLEGEVLKEATDAIYVDVGVDVIKIPRDRIRSRETVTTSENDAKPTAQNPNSLYLTTKLPTKSVKELTEDFGEGVVLVQTPGGLGSGFIINSRGFCVTNYHVVERETQIAVTIFDKTKTGDIQRRRINDVKILALNPYFDLALLQLPVQDDFDFEPVFLNDNDDIKEGDEVFAIGNPLGLERSVSEGIVSTRNRNFNGLVYIQTTTQINPGNSGGPLFNRKGEVIGVTNMKLAFGEGLGFAIPVSYVRHFLKNRDAFAYNKENPNTGYHYLIPPRKQPDKK